MWPFNRRKEEIIDTTEVPTEIQEYYNAERRERAGMAWLLALGTLLATLVLAVGLFFGGRWVYRKVAHKDHKPTTTSNVTKAPTDDKTKTTNPADKPSNTSTGTVNAPATPGGTTNTATPPAATNTATSTAAQQTATQSASTTKPSSTLPNTGPANTLGIFAVTVVVATSLYQLRLRRSSK